MRTRRSLLKTGMMAAAGVRLAPFAAAQARSTPTMFQPTWDSLKQWQMPDWFRDAKFGIWAHWSAQCVPEQGDWYGRKMYMQGERAYEYHVKTYGHPSKVGFKEIDHLWKAERWKPDEMMDLYRKAGAKYFMSLACHHDNLDCYDSKYHAWNTTKVGPRKDIVGTWEKIARNHGMRFGVSNHAAHAWHWWQTAYGYDAEGPLAGVRYDAYTTTAADGKGKWWDGLDPQKLYTGRRTVMPDGIQSIKEAADWHKQHDGKGWPEETTPSDPEYAKQWLLRCNDLVDKYRPDLIYFDDTELPLGQAGLDATAHFYNASMQWHGGNLEAVVAAKQYTPAHLGATMVDIERGREDNIVDVAWQTDTCIGDWHYDRKIFEEHRYKTAESVMQLLVDIVSKNGNLMLSIPVRGDGSLDEDEHAFLAAVAKWMDVHGEAIHGTRPFAVYGEGPVSAGSAKAFSERTQRPFDARDIRFTQKNGLLYAFVLGWPDEGKLKIATLAEGSAHMPKPVRNVQMLGVPGNVTFRRDGEALHVQLPVRPEGLGIYAVRIVG